MFTRAGTVGRTNMRESIFIFFDSDSERILVSIICTISWTLPRTGKSDICLKPVSRYSGGWTFGKGLTRACLYNVGYFLSRLLAQMISWTTTAKGFQVQALMLYVPVAFFELSSISNFFTCLMLGTRGELSSKPSGCLNVIFPWFSKDVFAPFYYSGQVKQKQLSNQTFFKHTIIKMVLFYQKIHRIMLPFLISGEKK